jgi:hypothetical protein
VIYWHILDREVVKSDGTKEIEHVFFLRYYTVFNYEQTENVKLPKGRVVPGRGGRRRGDHRGGGNDRAKVPRPRRPQGEDAGRGGLLADL